VNVDRRWWEVSAVRGRVLATGLMLLVAGCVVLGLGSRSGHTLANVASNAAGRVDSPLLLPASGSQSTSRTLPDARSLFAGLPIVFEPNQGQANLDPADARAKFVARGAGYSLFLGNQGAILSLVQQHAKSGPAAALPVHANAIEMKLVGANASASVAAIEPLKGESNYLLGNDPAEWHTGVPQFARVRYAGVYPGIDLVFYGNQGRLEYDFQVAPGADPARAELEFNGAKAVSVEDGALVIKSDGDDVRLEAPRVYQEVGGRKQPVDGKFVKRGANRVGFAIASYDHSRELVIDPILTFSTYFGGSGDEHSTSVAVDGSFNIYIAGSTTSPNLPAVGTFQTTLNGAQNAYVAKITPPLGSIVAALAYVTYLGGNGTDAPVGIQVDGRGDAFVAGTTSSTNFPVTPNAYQMLPKSGSTGTTHVFVTELNSGPSPAAASVLLYSTYLSGTGTDTASGMTIDSRGNVYVTGTTTSQDTASSTDEFPATTLPQMQAYQATPRSSIQFFVTKVNTVATGTGSISYSTYFGGGVSNTNPPVAVGGGIAVDTTGNVYFSGKTNFSYTGCAGCGTTDFPILDAYQACLDQPPATIIVNPPTCSTSTTTTASDAFVAKLNLNQNISPGQQLVWSTYLGGTGDDSSTGVALDVGAANVYVVGTTNSSDFVVPSTLATIASYQKCINNNPLTPTSGTVTCPQSGAVGTTDAFVARLSNPATSTGTAVNVSLGYFSYVGGANNETGNAISVDSASGALIAGSTQSPNTGAAGSFPVYPNPNSIQGTLNGPQDAFVARLNTGAAVGQTTIASWANYFGGTGTDSGTGIALDVNQNTYLAGDTNSADLQVNKPLPSGTTNSGGYDAFVAELGTAVSLSVQGTLSLGTNQAYIPAGTPATFTYIVTNNGPDLASGITLQDNLSTSVTKVPVSFVSASTSSGSCGGVTTGSVVSCSLAQLQSGSTATVTIVITPSGSASGGQATFNGGTVQLIGQGNIVYAQTFVPATLSDYTMTVGPPNQSVPVAGDPAVYTVQLTPNPLYTQPVTLSCSGQPANSTCRFNPSPVTMQGTSGSSSTFTINTTPRPIVTTANFHGYFYAIGLIIPGMVVMFGMGGSSRRKRAAGMLMLCLLMSLVLFIPACSHSTTQTPASGTPAGTYNVIVTATSGSDSKSQTVSITVP
jgi:uncharacterized repeat protein (TIGR01451 family)